MGGFKDTSTSVKGAIAENIILEFLKSKGYIVYSVVSAGSHKIDFFAHKVGKENKLIGVEVKAKRRRFIKEDTGFNFDTYQVYKEIMLAHNIDIYVFFVDEFEGCIYAYKLNDTDKGEIVGGVILFDLSKCTFIKFLTSDQIKELRRYTKPDGRYDNLEPYFKKDFVIKK